MIKIKIRQLGARGARQISVQLLYPHFLLSYKSSTGE